VKADYRELKADSLPARTHSKVNSIAGQIAKKEFKQHSWQMANTSKLNKEERKKAKRAVRKKIKAEKPKKPRDHARGSKKRKVKKLVRGQSKR